jgi:hypothetical protein
MGAHCSHIRPKQHNKQSLHQTHNSTLLYALINMTLDEEHTWENYFLRRWDAIADARGRNKSFSYAVGHVGHFPELHVKFHNPNTMQIPLPLVVLQDQTTSYVDTPCPPLLHASSFICRATPLFYK